MLPSRFRLLLPVCGAVYAAGQRFTVYQAFTRLIRHPVFFLLTYLLIGGLMVQNELLDTRGSLSALTKIQCAVSHPCSVWSRSFLVDPF